MAYRKVVYIKSQLEGVEKLEGETIEQKMERVIDNNEPITDGAPEIFTERKQGVMAAFNIRTDRFEIACDAMDAVSGSISAKRDNMALEQPKMDIVKEEVTGAESSAPKGAETGG